MRNLLIIILFLILSLTQVLAKDSDDVKIPIEITKIIDGDTVKAKIGNNEFSIRLIGIDCYESCKINRAYKQAYDNNISIDEVIKKGIESKIYLQRLLKSNKNQQVTFIFKGLDKYNRILGIIYIDELNVNEDLIKNGGCSEYVYKN